MMFIKLSIAIFLLRLATQRRYRFTIYGSIFVVCIWSIVLFFWNLFQCHPVEAQWDYRILANDKTASCVSADQIVDAAYSLSIMSILSDWFFALIPIPMVWSVKMTKQAKMTVVLVLGLGVFASIATLIRIKFLADLTNLDDLLCKSTMSSPPDQKISRLTATSCHDRHNDLDDSRAGCGHCRVEPHYDSTPSPRVEGQRISKYGTFQTHRRCYFEWACEQVGRDARLWLKEWDDY